MQCYFFHIDKIGSDYQDPTTSITFNSTVSEQCFSIHLQDDDVYEENEFVMIRMQTEDSAVVVPQSTVSIEIIDNEG